MTNSKECSVVLLPTDKGCIVLDKGKYYLVDGGDKVGYWFKSDHPRQPQHLYILSDEEIKEGDWVYNKRLGQIFQINNINSPSATDYKIIATTNPELIKNGVAEISDEFLQQWVKNPVDKVLVEYEGYYGENDLPAYGKRLKINNNNTINYKFIEDWAHIIKEYHTEREHTSEDEMTNSDFCKYLIKNYNPPTKK